MSVKIALSHYGKNTRCKHMRTRC